MKKFFKGKAVKFLATALITTGLVYLGAPVTVATQVANVLGEQAGELID